MLYEILKSAKLGTAAAPDMFTGLLAQKMKFAKGSGEIAELSGVPPLRFKSNGKPLLDWRITGATQGVGERTENLFDVKNATETDKFVKNDGTIETGTNGDKFLLQTIQCRRDTQYTFSWESIVLGSDNNTPYIRVAEYDSNNNFILRNLINCLDNDLYKRQTITTSSQTVKLDIRYDYNCSRGQTVNDVMLNIGNIALPYEPYGYKISVVCGGSTNNIYIGDSPLYDGNTISMADTGISIPTVRGNNTLTVDTTVQPSEVYIKYKK